MRLGTALGVIVAVCSSGPAFSQATCNGGSGADHIVFCRVYTSGEDQILVMRCASNTNGTWATCVDPADSGSGHSGRLDTDVVINGLGGNDVLNVVADTRTVTSAIPGVSCGTLSCNAWSDYGGHSITLTGGDDNDVIWSNGSGDERYYGGAGNDLITGGSGDNLYEGGPGADTLYDTGGTNDALYGDCSTGICGVTGDDCLDDQASSVLNCGPGTDKYVLGCTCDSGCNGCANCETRLDPGEHVFCDAYASPPPG